MSKPKMSELIRKKRQNTQIEQKKLASLVDLSPSQVNRIEKNKVNPSYESVYKIWSKLEQLEKDHERTANDLMNSPVSEIKASDTVEQASKTMKKNCFSQLPVKRNGKTNAGKITEAKIMAAEHPDEKVSKVMGPPFMVVGQEISEKILTEVLKEEPAVLVKNQDSVEGIITKTDLI